MAVFRAGFRSCTLRLQCTLKVPNIIKETFREVVANTWMNISVCSYNGQQVYAQRRSDAPWIVSWLNGAIEPWMEGRPYQGSPLPEQTKQPGWTLTTGPLPPPTRNFLSSCTEIRATPQAQVHVEWTTLLAGRVYPPSTWRLPRHRNFAKN